MSELLANIEKAEAKLRDLAKILKETRKKFEQDGVITKEEDKKLKELETKIRTAEDKVADARADYGAYEEKWNNKSGDLAELQAVAAELKEWENPAAGEIEKALAEIADLADKGWWKKAVEALEAAEAKAAKPYAEIEKQRPYKLQYETNSTYTQKRYETVQDSDYSGAKPVRDAVVGVDKCLSDAFKSEKARDYEKALKDLQGADDALDKVEEAIKQLEVAHDTYLINREMLDERLEKLRNHDWQSEVVERAVSQIENNMGAVDGAADAHDYDQANELLAIGYDYLDEAEKDIAANSPEDMPTKKVTMPDGKVLAFTDKEFEERKAEICKQLKNGPVRGLKLAAEILDDCWTHYRDLNNDQWAVAKVIEIVAWTELPPRSMVENALGAAKQVESAVNSNDIDTFLKIYPGAEKQINDAKDTMQKYQADVEFGGTVAITTLEFTKTASFVFVGVFAGPAVGAVAGTGVVASAVIGGAAVAATQSSATEVGHYIAGTPGWTPGQAVSNVLIDTSVGAITGLIAKGGSSDVAKQVTAKVAAKLAAQKGFERLSKNAIAKVAAFLLKEGAKQALEDAVKDVGAMLKGDPKMTMEVFIENIATNFLKGMALGAIGKVIDDFAEGAIEKLAASDIAKIEELALKETLNQLGPEFKGDILDEAEKRAAELAKKYVGDMIKKNGELFVEKVLPVYSGPFDPKAIDKAIRDYMFSSPEMKEAFNKTAAQVVKEITEEAKKKEAEST